MQLSVITLKIDNCMDYPHSLVSDIFTADSWEHEVGCFCKKTVDEKYKRNGQIQLVLGYYRIGVLGLMIGI